MEIKFEKFSKVVIDKHDIKEAVSNESQVIIVDPPATPADSEQHVDLGDILGGEWPELQVGSVASLLNAEKKSTVSSSINVRNKSANIASHFSSSKPRRVATEDVIDIDFTKRSE